MTRTSRAVCSSGLLQLYKTVCPSDKCDYAKLSEGRDWYGLRSDAEEAFGVLISNITESAAPLSIETKALVDGAVGLMRRHVRNGQTLFSAGLGYWLDGRLYSLERHYLGTGCYWMEVTPNREDVTGWFPVAKSMKSKIDKASDED